jgi:hypothetical protein
MKKDYKSETTIDRETYMLFTYSTSRRHPWSRRGARVLQVSPARDVASCGGERRGEIWRRETWRDLAAAEGGRDMMASYIVE